MTMGNYRLSADQKDMILNKLAELSTVLGSGNGVAKKASTLSANDKEQLVTQLFRDPTGRGLKRVAYAKYVMV
jgi:hypothetical protein